MTLRCDLPTKLLFLQGDKKRESDEVLSAKALTMVVDGWEQWGTRRDQFDSQFSRHLAGKPECFAGLSWGRVKDMMMSKVNPITGLAWEEEEGVFLDRTRRATGALAAINKRLEEAYDLPPRKTAERSGTAKLVYFPRGPSKKDRDGVRVVQDDSQILEACEQMGWQCETCCDWGNMSHKDLVVKLRDASVVMGPHGAGLASVLLARKGATLVDFAPGSWSDNFALMAYLNEGGSFLEYVPTTPRSPGDAGMVIGKEEALEMMKTLGFQSRQTLLSNATSIVAAHREEERGGEGRREEGREEGGKKGKRG